MEGVGIMACGVAIICISVGAWFGIQEDDRKTQEIKDLKQQIQICEATR